MKKTSKFSKEGRGHFPKTGILKRTAGHRKRIAPRHRALVGISGASLWLGPPTPGERLRSKARGAELSQQLAKIAKTPVERKAACYGPCLLDWSPLAKTKDDDEREFLFRCYFVPQFCIHALKTARKLWGIPPRFLWEHGCYLLAFERTHFQMVLQRTNSGADAHGYKDDKWLTPCGAAAFAHLPKPGLDWFADPPGERGFWLKAFEDWKEAAVDSVKHRYPASSGPTDRCMYAALAGDGLAGWKSLKKLHRAFTAYFEDQGSAELRSFITHLAKPEFEGQKPNTLSRAPKNEAPGHQPPPDSEATAKMALTLETWLLEIAPLVRENDWGYSDILQIAKAKFGGKHEMLVTTGQIRSRCEKVALRLSPKAQIGGRPSKSREVALRNSPLAHLAAALRSIGEGGDEWMLGQRGLCGEPISKPWSEKGNLFTRIGTNDPGPERAWI